MPRDWASAAIVGNKPLEEKSFAKSAAFASLPKAAPKWSGGVGPREATVRARLPEGAGAATLTVALDAALSKLVRRDAMAVDAVHRALEAVEGRSNEGVD